MYGSNVVYSTLLSVKLNISTFIIKIVTFGFVVIERQLITFSVMVDSFSFFFAVVLFIILFNRINTTIHMACQQIKSRLIHPVYSYGALVSWKYVLEILANNINHTCSFFVRHSHLLVLTNLDLEVDILFSNKKTNYVRKFY